MRWLFWVASVALATTVGSCDHATAPPAPSLADIVGAYSLATVNGSPPPAPMPGTSAESLVVRSAGIRLELDGSFSATMTRTVLSGAFTTLQETHATGVYSRSGTSLGYSANALARAFPIPGTVNATISGGRITIRWTPGDTRREVTFVFTR